MPKISRIFIIYFTWPNTARNHAGMVYLVKKLKKKYPIQIHLLEIPSGINKWQKKVQRFYFYFIVYRLKYKLKKNDKVLFMEYLGNRSGNQTGIAIKLRQLGVKNEFTGLVHLPEKSLIEIYGGKDYIIKAANHVDKILTFGSSLSSFFSKLGFKDKTITTFHYVETDYYKPGGSNQSNDKLNVIHIGSLKRNFHRLKEVIIQCPGIQFHVCQGNNDLRELFKAFSNVNLYGFMEEKDLLQLMQQCDVSLSILDDTVGSNVITTSLACGLINVVSDMGSIRDYCSENNSLLCQSNKDFIEALNQLKNDPHRLRTLSQQAVKRAEELNLHRFESTFEKIFLS
jgi:glycosyltransferase involved in cell wall biosynthesis